MEVVYWYPIIHCTHFICLNIKCKSTGTRYSNELNLFRWNDAAAVTQCQHACNVDVPWQWRHISVNTFHRQLACFFNRLSRLITKNISMIRVIGPFVNGIHRPPASIAEYIPKSWHHFPPLPHCILSSDIPNAACWKTLDVHYFYCSNVLSSDRIGTYQYQAVKPKSHQFIISSERLERRMVRFGGHGNRNEHCLDNHTSMKMKQVWY